MIIVVTTSDRKEFAIKARWEDFDPSENGDMLYLEREDGGVFAALPALGAANIVMYADDRAYVQKSSFYWTMLSEEVFQESLGEAS